MTQKQISSHNISGDWRLFGETKLPFSPDPADHLNTWLMETLRPLNLSKRFLDKLLESAKLAAGGLPLVERAPDHVHMQIYTPVESTSNQRSWGFFRVEKKGDPQAADSTNFHAIAFYLYREGS